jgi:hypothetical protein
LLVFVEDPGCRHFSAALSDSKELAMRVVTALHNAKDVLKAGSLDLNGSLLRAELTQNHRIFSRRFVAELLPKGGVGAEIGVFTGLFSTILLDVARPSHAYFVDPWWEAFGQNYPNWGRYTDHGRLSTSVAHRTAVRRINSHARDAKTEVLVEYSTTFFPRTPDRHFDWIYLDSTHSYEGTVKELELIKTKLKRGAILAGDDWHDDPAHRHHGIAKAVLEAVSRGEYEEISRFPALQWAVRAL